MLRSRSSVGSEWPSWWALENDCRCSPATCAYAAAGGHLALLRWAREHDCPWGASTCAAAAQNGHLEVLKWAREHRCPWTAETCALAAKGGRDWWIVLATSLDATQLKKRGRKSRSMKWHALCTDELATSWDATQLKKREFKPRLMT